jgi:hypothetical protein
VIVLSSREIVSAFCQKPVNGLSKGPKAGIVPQGRLAAQISNMVIASERVALA